jgi:hypothetical protein
MRSVACITEGMRSQKFVDNAKFSKAINTFPLIPMLYVDMRSYGQFLGARV